MASRYCDNGLEPGQPDRRRQAYLYYRTSCPASGHCIPVRERTNATLPEERQPPPGNSFPFGCTDVDFVNPDPFGINHIEDARIWLNNSTSTTSTQRRKTTCHEIGHALGLSLDDDHRNTNASCLRSGAAPPIMGVPDAHDYEALGNLYDHAR